MPNFEQSIMIHKPIERVFEIACDHRYNPKWQPGLVEARVNPEGPPQVGTVATYVRNYTGENLEATVVITELEPNKLMRFRNTSGPFSFQASIAFEAVEEGTVVTFAVVMDGPQEMADALSKDIGTSLTKLKELLEQQDLRHIAAGAGPKYMIVGADIITYKIVGDDKDTRGVFFLSETKLPLDGGPRLHRHVYEETFYILEGELEFTGGGLQPEFIAHPGDVIHVPSYAPHGYRALTDARLLIIFTPAGVEHFFAAVGTPIPEENILPDYKLPDPAFRAEVMEKYKIELLAPITLSHFS